MRKRKTAKEREETKMAMTIITQNGSAVNYNNLITISVERGELPNAQTGVAEEKIAVIGSDILGEVIVIGAYDSAYAANRIMNEITDWLTNSMGQSYIVPPEES